MPVARVTRTRWRSPPTGSYVPAPNRWVECASSPSGTSAVAVPLRQEEVAAVVADLHEARVHRRDLGDVRRVQDDLAPVGHHRLHLVEALGPRPQVRVPRGDEGEHPPHRAVEIDDVRLRRHLGRGRPGAERVPEGQRLQAAAVVVHDDAQGVALAGHELGRRLHQCPHGRDPTRADDLAARDQRPEPVRHVDHLLAGQPGEQVLVPSREADDLVGQHRADEQRHVALDNEPVEPDVDRVMKPAARELHDQLRRQRADVREGVVLPPRVVADGKGGRPDQRGHGVVGHGCVGAEGDHRGQCTRPSAGSLFDGPEEQGQRAVPGRVGDDHAQRATGQVQCGDLGAHERAHRLGFEHPSGPPERHRHSPTLQHPRSLCGQPLQHGRDLGGERGVPEGAATELPERAAPGGGTEILGDRILQAGKRHATHLHARHAGDPDGRHDGERCGVERPGPAGRHDGEQALGQFARSVGADLDAGVAQSRVGESPQRLVGECRGLQRWRQRGHLERLFDELPYEASDDGICHGRCDGGAPGQQAAVRRGGVRSVEEPELAAFEGINVVDQLHADLAEVIQPADRPHDPGTVAFRGDGSLVDEPELVGDVLPTGFGGRRNHAVDDRAGEAHLVGDPRRQGGIDGLGCPEDPRPQHAAVVQKVVERCEDRRRRSLPAALGQRLGDERRRAGRSS